MAPVGRWQKGKDLNWYAKADDAASDLNETAEERRVRERKEEIRKIKEAEEDALSKALGLPVTSRNGGQGTGANDIDIGEMRKVIKETEEGDDEIDQVGKNAGFGDFGAKRGQNIERDNGDVETQQGGLLGKAGKKERHDRHERYERSRRKERDERRSRSRSRERRHRRQRQRSRSPEPHRLRDEQDERRSRRHRSRSGERHRRHRSRSAEPHRSRKDERERRRSRSPDPRGRTRRWERDGVRRR